MRLIEQSFVIEHVTPDALHVIERAGRTCWRSEGKADEDSAERFVRMILKKGHHALLEFAAMTVRCMTNRGVTHELVRHRLASFAQQSTRYVGEVDGELEFIRPVWWGSWVGGEAVEFRDALETAEKYYYRLLRYGCSRDMARELLPNALAAEIVIRANLRQWRHIFALRAVGTTGRPHPQMQALMSGILAEARRIVPVVFDGLEPGTREAAP